jgi:hypothetical protein
VKYRHHLGKGLIDGLKALFEGANGKLYHPVNLKNLKLTRNQWDNFQKLRYWGLVEQSFDHSGRRRKGFWEMTAAGSDFLLWGVAVPSTVVTYRGRPVEFCGSMVTLPTAELDPVYLKQEDYAREAQGV